MAVFSISPCGWLYSGSFLLFFRPSFLSIAYTGRLTPDDYEVLHVEQTEYDQSIGAYDSGIIRRFSDYLVTVQYEVDGTRYTLQIFHWSGIFHRKPRGTRRCRRLVCILAPFSIKVPIQNA